MTLWKGVYHQKNPRFIKIFSICTETIWLSWLIHQSWPCTAPLIVSCLSSWSTGLTASCRSSWSTVLALEKYTCNNVELWRCKLTNALTIPSANYLYLHLEQLFRTHWQFIRKNFKIMSMEKLRLQALTCKVLFHNEVFHNKLLNTCAFLFSFLCPRFSCSHFIAYALCLVSHKTDMQNMW